VRPSLDDLALLQDDDLVAVTDRAEPVRDQDAGAAAQVDYLNLTDTMMHTIGGMLMHELRHLPRPGESVIISGYRFIADEVTDKAVQSIIVEPA